MLTLIENVNLERIFKIVIKVKILRQKFAVTLPTKVRVVATPAGRCAAAGVCYSERKNCSNNQESNEDGSPLAREIWPKCEWKEDQAQAQQPEEAIGMRDDKACQEGRPIAWRHATEESWKRLDADEKQLQLTRLTSTL